LGALCPSVACPVRTALAFLTCMCHGGDAGGVETHGATHLGEVRQVGARATLRLEDVPPVLKDANAAG
jgi:hypothetical protein